MEVLRQAARWADEGRRGALVTVARVRGSTPRHQGARMLVDDAGATVGTIGGGRVELEVTELGARIARGEAPAQRVTHHLVRDLAMCCGGSMDFWIEPVTGNGPVLVEVVERLRRREVVHLVTQLATGHKRIEPGPPPEATTIDDERMVERIAPSYRVVLFGSGHVARAIGPLAREVGFHVAVCDDNATGALDREPGFADQVVPSFEVADVDAALGPLGALDSVLILTRDHAVDERLVGQLLPRAAELGYLGLIGSAGKIGRFRKRLEARGLADGWERLSAPIGLDIGAETPAEIAVSVMAELIQVRRRGRG